MRLVKVVLIGVAGLALATPALAQTSGPILLVGNKGEDSVSRIDLTTGRETKRVDSCSNPHEISVAPDKKHFAVGCYGGQSIQIFSVEAFAPVKDIDLGAGAKPHGLLWLNDGRVVATAEGRGSIMVLSDVLGVSPKIQEIRTGQDVSHMVVVSADGQTAWTSNMGSGSVTRIDLARGKAERSQIIGGGAEGITLSPDGKSLWASSRATSELVELDPVTLAKRRSMKVGKTPVRAITTGDGSRIITSNFGDGSISFVDVATGRVTTNTLTGSDKVQQVTLLISPDGNRLYVAETMINKIAEVDLKTGELIGRLSAGGAGDGLAIIE